MAYSMRRFAADANFVCKVWIWIFAVVLWENFLSDYWAGHELGELTLMTHSRIVFGAIFWGTGAVIWLFTVSYSRSKWKLALLPLTAILALWLLVLTI